MITFNIMGDELRWQSRIFDMFNLDRIHRELRSLECSEHKFGLGLEFFNKYLLESFLMCSFVFRLFLKHSFYDLASS